jgi:ketosteroid isomerase-like protein
LARSFYVKSTLEGNQHFARGVPVIAKSTVNEAMSDADDKELIEALYHAGDSALMAADVAVLDEILADDYVQHNESGKAFTKQDVLANFRSGAIRYPSIVSTSRIIRLFGDIAVVHGSEDDIVETKGERSSVRYIYLDVLRKINGEWKIVASQLARPRE